MLAGAWFTYRVYGANAPVADSTRAMAERLDKIIQSANPLENPFMSAERAQAFADQMATARTPAQVLNAQTRWAMELLNAGETDRAIEQFRQLADAYQKSGLRIPQANQTMLRNLRAIAYLRQAEQDNCLSNHTSESCLFPIRGLGVHSVQRGSRAAMEVLLEQLREVPDDLRARWLLNVAAMTLGEYPEKVPSQWLLDPSLFQSPYDIKRFPEISAALGLDIDDLAGGSIAEDFDGDGYLDVMASSMALRGQLRYFHNQADGTFAERTEASGLQGEIGGLQILQTDYNNDGFPDVLVLRGGWMLEGGKYPNSLLRNNGHGTFTDVTVEAGLLSFHPTQTAVWFDFDLDGWLDLFIGNESSEGYAHRCELYRNNRDGTFTECAPTMGVAVVAYVKGVTSADFNNDGWPDLYLSCRGQPNILFRNDGPSTGTTSTNSWKFTDVSVAARVTEPLVSFPTWFFDYDNDGWPDLFVSGYDLKNLGDIAADYLGRPFTSERPRLYHNDRDGTFSDVTHASGLDHLLHTMGCNYGDLDNDGYLDFYLGTGDPNLGTLIPNRMFRNSAGRSFQDVTASGGFGHLQKGHGVSFADFDNDGDEDIYTVMGGAYPGDHYRNAFFENPGHGNHWICLKLEGHQSNRAAIGARIKLVTENAAGTTQTIFRTVGTGSSFGANPLRQEIGLGDAKAIRSLEIFWPVTGKTHEVAGCVLDRFYRVQEGKSDPTPWMLKTFRLKSNASDPHAHHRH